ncbi:MAG TPA: hypothetical protein VGN12_21185 [Pirellulales bacterium]
MHAFLSRLSRAAVVTRPNMLPRVDRGLPGSAPPKAPAVKFTVSLAVTGGKPTFAQEIAARAANKKIEKNVGRTYYSGPATSLLKTIVGRYIMRLLGAEPGALSTYAV